MRDGGCGPWCPAPEQARSDVEAGLAAGLQGVQAGHYREAELRLRPALALAQRSLGEDDIDTGQVLNALGMVDKYTAHFEEGRMFYERALVIAEHANPVQPLAVADVLHNLGGLEHACGRFTEGEPFARRAVDVRAGALGADHVAVAADRAALAAILAGEGESDEAESLLVSAIATFDRAYGPNMKIRR